MKRFICNAFIALHLSGQFSGTYANSVKAGERIKREFNKPVFVIDSKRISGTLGLLVLKTAQRIEAREGVEPIVNSLISRHSQNRKGLFIKSNRLCAGCRLTDAIDNVIGPCDGLLAKVAVSAVIGYRMGTNDDRRISTLNAF